MPIARRRLVACALTVLACIPYLSLKLAWLAGSSVGIRAGAETEMHGVRYLVGNLVTVGMDLVAVLLVLSLTFRWGRRLPGWLLAAPVWVAAGLLAPIAVGLPVGLVVQGIAGGSATVQDDGLHGWVYGVVYGGFVLQALGLLGAFWWHARERWRDRLHPTWLPAGTTVRVAVVVAGLFGGLHLLWALAGRDAGRPDGFETAAQCTFLAATGLLILAGAAAVTRLASPEPRLASPGHRGPAAWPGPVAWVGAAVTVFAGPTKILLAHGGHAGALVVVTGLLGTVAGLVMAGTLCRAIGASVRAVPAQMT